LTAKWPSAPAQCQAAGHYPFNPSDPLSLKHWAALLAPPRSLRPRRFDWRLGQRPIPLRETYTYLWDTKPRGAALCPFSSARSGVS